MTEEPCQPTSADPPKLCIGLPLNRLEIVLQHVVFTLAVQLSERHDG
jgi:hypothetical protein